MQARARKQHDDKPRKPLFREWHVDATALLYEILRTAERRRMPPFAWTFTVLNGLDEHVMHDTNRVLQVIRRRLERYAEEMRVARRGYMCKRIAA